MSDHCAHELQWRARRAEKLLAEVYWLLADFIDDAADLVTEAHCVVFVDRSKYEKHIMERDNDE